MSEDRKIRELPCLGCKHMDQLKGFPGTGYCKLGKGRKTILSRRCEFYKFDAQKLKEEEEQA